MSAIAKDAVRKVKARHNRHTTPLNVYHTLNSRPTPIHLVTLNCLSYINKRSLALRVIDYRERERERDRERVRKNDLRTSRISDNYYVTSQMRKARAKQGSSRDDPEGDLYVTTFLRFLSAANTRLTICRRFSGLRIQYWKLNEIRADKS